MKKLFSLLALCAVALVACDPNDELFSPDPEFKLTSEANVLFDADGGDGKITYTLHYAAEGQGVSAEADVDWITNIAVSDKVVNYIVKANDSADLREGKVYLKHDIYTLTVNVKQQGKSDGPNVGSEYDVEYIANFINGSYYGGTNSYNYYFSMSKNGQPGAGLINYDSDYYFFDIYSDIPVGTGDLLLPQGVYEFDANNTGVPGTFGQEYSYYTAVDANGNQTQKAILDGTLTITNDKIDAIITLDDNTVHHVVYSGSLELGYPHVSISTLDGDYEFNHQNAVIYAEGFGDDYDIGYEVWYLTIFADGTTYSGDAFTLELLNSDPNSPAGTYTALDDTATDYGYTFIPGELEDGELYCTWYLTTTNGEYNENSILAPIVNGDIIITIDETDEATVATIQMDCWDDADNNIYGVISGAITVSPMQMGATPSMLSPKRLDSLPIKSKSKSVRVVR